MKKIVSIAIFIILLPICFPVLAQDPGYALYSKICAYINHYPIESYNIDGYTYVTAEDLTDYGFSVTFNAADKTLSIERGSQTQITPTKTVYRHSAKSGTIAKTIYNSDIAVYVNGSRVKGYNIDGYTLINIESLGVFGEYMWVPEVCAAKLWIDGLPFGDFALPEEYPAIDPSRPVIALTFDDGPSQYTPAILRALARNNAEATFFVVGSRADSYPDTLRQTLLTGSEIGNHSYSHAQLSKLSPQECAAEITKTDDIIFKHTGVRPRLMRTPYGNSSNTVMSTAGKPNILWSVDTLDWKTRNADSVYNSVVGKVRDGDIILMHDLYKSSADAAVRIIDELSRRGYQMVTVSELGEYKYGSLTNSTYHSMR